MKDIKELKVALVHDFLIYSGGAENVLEVLAEIFPEAPIYTLLYDKEKMRGVFKGREIKTSFLQKFPKFLRRHHQWLLPFYPIAPEMFDLREFDLVISSSGAWSKGIITKLNTIHIAYIHSPMRFVWDWTSQYLKENKREKFRIFIRPILSYLRIWDKLASERPDYLIANSKYTQERIKKYYRRESTVIYPPVEVKLEILNPEKGRGPLGTLRPKSETNSKFEITNSKNTLNGRQATSYKLKAKSYFLVVSRLSPCKKVDKVIEAFNKLELPLVVVGEGKQEKYLRSIAKKNIQILGWQSDEKIAKLYAGARAFIFPSLDDFGIAPVEAMAYGIPVIAVRDGGALETVIEGSPRFDEKSHQVEAGPPRVDERSPRVEAGKTGEFFNATTPEVIADGVRRFMENEGKYDKEFIIENAERFGKERFKREIEEFVSKTVNFQ